MDAEKLVEDVRDSMETELHRLGTSKGLMAATDGDLDPDAVMEAAATAERDAAETFEAWAEDEDSEESRLVFRDVAEVERGHLERVDREPSAETSPLHDYLRGLDGTEERVAAGLVGRALVSDASLKQTVGYFVGQSDTQRADLFRELRQDNQELLERGVELLDRVCSDWDSARGAAEEVIEVAYDDYVETLEGMGVNPKPVC